ncbi:MULTISPECIES: deoxynucleoside kinase [Spongiibacter]|jgi:deoxyadenosine/deoxycytidine kinase|uniref:deoxynucleoside kinase n=1 Tax=Spongiibacter TaxID=630749 RepID=UPI0019620CC2|nr:MULTISPECIES: deoxynucleoside kinase [Spongiibacter]MBM7424878.1 deoxyadenosine/deoxycytidine kinase [Spongiibacter marinus]|tara:strand:+ start:13333 stop:13998 length:666 start_codon:yes stop_codon:yes gene_type:complete
MQNRPLFKSDAPPRHIAIEGPIGVGKSTLMRRLAESLGYATLEEKADENPFLERFYSNRQHAALATQLFFLFQRAQQLSDLQQSDLFAQGYVADFLFQKDPLFAQLTLDANELELYQKVYQQLAVDLPPADLVIYLQAPSKVLKDRIQQRGVRFERNIDSHYLEQVNEAYSEYFLHYSASPLLIVNAEDIDFAHNDRDYQQLLDYLLEIPSGRHYFNPTFF